jgi:CheY-like chemotaxis protein
MFRRGLNIIRPLSGERKIMETNLMEGWAADTAAADPAYILVVEDEVFVRMFLTEALRDVGYKVLEAFNGDEAVEILVSGAHVDLVLSDVRMPGSVDGLELLAYVRKNFPDLPVLLCSGHLDPSEALQRGANHFLSKPYPFARAHELIRTELMMTFNEYPPLNHGSMCQVVHAGLL